MPALRTRKYIIIMNENVINSTTPSEPQTYTTGHCKEKAKPGGCQLHNLQCGYPECDRHAAPPAAPAAERDDFRRKVLKWTAEAERAESALAAANERERGLRDALEDIAKESAYGLNSSLTNIRSIARAALARKEGDE